MCSAGNGQASGPQQQQRLMVLREYACGSANAEHGTAKIKRLKTWGSDLKQPPDHARNANKEKTDATYKHQGLLVHAT